jgi:hypothetical protein
MLVAERRPRGRGRVRERQRNVLGCEPASAHQQGHDRPKPHPIPYARRSGCPGRLRPGPVTEVAAQPINRASRSLSSLEGTVGPGDLPGTFGNNWQKPRKRACES